MALNHAQARQWAHEGFVSIFNREPTLLEIQFVQAVALIESQYGYGWKNDGVGSWNMGAVQSGHAPCNPATSFEYTDTHPTSSGVNVRYTICFKKYPGPVEGMADIARIMYKQMNITPTDIETVATQLYEHHYYEGWGATKEIRIGNEIKRMTQGLKDITAALDEPMPPANGGAAEEATPKVPSQSPPSQAPVYYLGLSSSPRGAVASVHEGMKDSHLVGMVQLFLKTQDFYHGKIDNDYGPLTEAAVRAFLGIV